MSEIIYQYPSGTVLPKASNQPASIRRLRADDYPVFVRHLELCGQRPISRGIWNEIFSDGTIYFGLFESGEMVARACREIITPDQWEIADVRVVSDFRNRGLAFQICRHVLEYIISEGKTPTIRTEEHNIAMQKIIAKLGFAPVPQ